MTEADGTTYEGWSEESITIQGSVQPLSGKLAAEMYGERLNYMLAMYVERSPETMALLEQFNSSEKGFDAHISNAETPDYKVVAMHKWRHIVIELEKVR